MELIQLFAVTKNGPLSLPVRPGAQTIHQVFDELPIGVYTALCTFQHVKFLDLEGHMIRLENSINLLGWNYQIDNKNLLQSLHKVCTDYPMPDARVRIDVLAAPASTLGTDSRLLIALAPFEALPGAMYNEGVRVGVASDLNRQDPLVKKAEFVLRRRQFLEENPDYYECLMMDSDGNILEGTTSNFYGIKNGKIWTAGHGVLEGIARKLILQVAAELSIPVKFDPVPIVSVSKLDEAALSSSSRAIVPIVQISDQLIGNGKPGPVVQELLAAYNRQVIHMLKPAVDTDMN